MGNFIAKDEQITEAKEEETPKTNFKRDFITRKTEQEIASEISGIRVIPYGGVGYDNLTGSSSLVEITRKRNGKTEKQYIAIDLGLYQGLDKNLELALNKTPPFPQHVIKRLIALVITHSHVDHCGRAPMLANGKFERPVFNGPIYAHNVCTRLMYYIWQEAVYVMSKELYTFEERRDKIKNSLREHLSLLKKFRFSNSQRSKDKKNGNGKKAQQAKNMRKKIQEDEEFSAEITNAQEELKKYGIEKEADIQKIYEKEKSRIEKNILYDNEDVSSILSLVRGLSDSDQKNIGEGVDLKLIKANHILGSSQALLKIYDDYGKHFNLLFSGDLGRIKDPFILPQPDIPEEEIDFVQMEATYGDADHPDRWQEIEKFAESLNKITEKNGKILIPVFKQQRLQDIACLLVQLQRQGIINDKLKIYADGANTAEICNIYKTNFVDENGHPTYKDLLNSPNFKVITEKKQNNPFLNSKESSIMLAPAGMLNGGAVHSYIKHIVENSNHALCLAGYQAEGTLGREIQEAKEAGIPYIKDKTLGVLEINSKIIELNSQSGHADQSDLLEYLKKIPKRENKDLQVAINHGEEAKMETLQGAIRSDKELREKSKALISTLKEPITVFEKKRSRKKTPVSKK